MNSILPACFIISWYKFTTASILAKDSGEGGMKSGCQPGLTVPPQSHPWPTDRAQNR